MTTARILPFTPVASHYTAADRQLQASLAELRARLTALQAISVQAEVSHDQLANAQQVDARLDAMTDWLRGEVERFRRLGSDN